MAAIDLQLHMELDEILKALQEAGWVRPVRCRECFFGRPIKFADGSDMIACDFDRGASRFPEFYCKAGMRKEDDQPEPPDGGGGDG